MTLLEKCNADVFKAILDIKQKDLIIGEKLLVRPSHIDPTMAMHSVAWVTRSDEVLECWQIDLRGW